MGKILKGKVVVVTGGSRGIGREIALRCAKEGAHISLAAKTIEPHPKLPGTLLSVAEEVKAFGVQCLAIPTDVREEDHVERLAKETAQALGGIDIWVNNAGAISLSSTMNTPIKKFDLMLSVNGRAVFASARAAYPFLRKSSNPHILNLSPPISMEKKWLAPHVAYSISKYAMSMCTLGMAEEFREDKIAVNSLWPMKIIATAATQMLLGEKGVEAARTPEIMAEAALAIFSKNSSECTGNLFLDEEVLKKEGVRDFSKFNCVPGLEPLPDLFV
jgi:citronellol/citronellal dehydrogenase